jgi:hypothetical protein
VATMRLPMSPDIPTLGTNNGACHAEDDLRRNRREISGGSRCRIGRVAGDPQRGLAQQFSPPVCQQRTPRPGWCSHSWSLLGIGLPPGPRLRGHFLRSLLCVQSHWLEIGGRGRGSHGPLPGVKATARDTASSNGCDAAVEST